MSAFKSQKSANIKEYLQAATSFTMTVVAVLESEHASSSNAQAVIQGKDVPANVRGEVNQLTQDLYQSAPAEFWESGMYDIEAIEATAIAIIVNYLNRSFADYLVTSQMLHTSMQCTRKQAEVTAL